MKPVKTSANPSRFYGANFPPKATILNPKTKPRRSDVSSAAISQSPVPASPSRSARETTLLNKYASLVSKSQKQLYGYIAFKPCVVEKKKKKPSVEEVRKAAREALEKMVPSVEIDDHWKTMKEMQ